MVENQQENYSEPMSDKQFIAFLIILPLILITLWIGNNEEKIIRGIYNGFVPLGMFIYCLSCFGLFLLKTKMESNLKKDRVFNLAKVWNEDDGVFLGKTKDDVKIHLPDKTRTGHVQIIGATGRGKTESLILPMMVRDLKRGKSAVLIDGKGDQELASRIKNLSAQKVITFDLGDLKNSAVTNPLMEGTAQQITDRLFAALEFKDEFYKAVQYEITSSMVELIHEQKLEVTFKLLFELFTNDQKLTELMTNCKEDMVIHRFVNWLNESRRERDQKTAGIISQLGPLAKGEIAPLVNGESNGKEFFSLSKLLTSQEQEPFALVILLPTLLYQELAFKLGKLFLQEVAWSVAARKEKEFTPIFLDEFSSFVYPGFLGILNKARSSGIALHLSHQSLGDLEMVSPEFAKAINTNTNVKCLLGLNDPMTADFFAKHLGTFTEEKVTERANEKGIIKTREMTGELSVRDVESYRIHPNTLKSFTRGKGVIQFHLPEGGDILEEIQFEALNQKEVA